MANITITGLPVATSLTGSEEVEVVQSGVSTRTTAGQIAGLASSSISVLTNVTAARVLGRQTGAGSGAVQELTLGVDGSGNVAVSGALQVSGHATVEGVTSTGATGTGAFVFATSPTLVTPTLGVASATSINGLGLSGTASSSLAISGGYAATLTISGATNVTLPTSGTLATTAVFNSSTAGLVPASGADPTLFLRADGTFASPSGSGTVNAGTAAQLAYYGTTTNAVSGNANATIANGALTLGQAGSVLGQVKLSGSTSGVVTITAKAVAGTWTWTLPDSDGTDGQTLVTDGAGTTSWETLVAMGTANQLAYYSSSAHSVSGNANATISNGDLTLGVQQTTAGSLTLANVAAGAYAAKIQSSPLASVATTLTLPPDAGTNGYVLATDGAGITSWVAQSGGGGGGSTPGGSSTQVQYNSSGVMAGAAGVTTNGTDLTLSSASLLGWNTAGADLILRRVAAAKLALGGADAATPTAQTLTMQSASGTDKAGGKFTIAGSLGTGTGNGGAIQFAISLPSTTGSSQNAATDIAYFSGATGALLWNTTNTRDIGASAGNRPKDLYLAGNATIGAAGSFIFDASSKISSASDGIVAITNSAGNDFTRLQFGGTSASYPALTRSTTSLRVTLANSTTLAPFAAESGSFGANSGTIGTVKLFGSTSGDVTITPLAVAGTGTTITLPATSGTVALKDGDLGTPTILTLTYATGLPISTGLYGAGSGVKDALSYNVGSANSFVVNGGALGTPSSGTLTSCTGLPLTTGVTGTLGVANGGTGITSLGTGVATALGNATNGAGGLLVTDGTATLTNKTFDTAGTGNVFKVNGTQISDKTGTGKAVLDTSPTLTTPNIGAATGTSLNLSSSAFVADNAGNLTLTRGLLAAGSAGTFTGSFTDGVVVDYDTGNARISTGTGDVITFYNGGVANAQLAQISAAGALTLAAGIVGKTNATDAAAGQVGEFKIGITDFSSRVTLSSASPYDIATLNLPAGDWDLTGFIFFTCGGSAASAFEAGISAVSVTLPSLDTSNGIADYAITTTLNIGTHKFPLGTIRINISTQTTYYLVAQRTGGGTGSTSWGYIRARRVR